MSAETTAASEARAQRLCELAAIGAGSAAGALEQLLDRPFRAGAATLRTPVRGVAEGNWGAAAFFEAYGELRGVIALMLSPATCEALACLSIPPGGHEAGSDPADSALCECGNIVASQTVSQIANTLNARVMLSVPTLVKNDPEAELADWIAERHGSGEIPWIESELLEPEGELHAMLVVVPDALVSEP